MLNAEDLEDLPPIQGPKPSSEWFQAHRLRVVREAEEAEAAQQRDWLAEIQALAQREVDAWKRYACGGEIERVTACSEANAKTCDRADRMVCPRNRLLELAQEAAEAKRGVRSTLARSGVPERVLGAVYDAPAAETPAVVALRTALTKQPTPCIVVLSGGVGAGKSCAAGLWLAQHKGGVWVSASELNRISPYDAEHRERFNAGRLVLDDLGTEYLDGKDFLLSNLDGVINHRYGEMLPTVITTNLSMPDFRARYGPRITDRLREAGEWLQVGGESLRRRK